MVAVATLPYNVSHLVDVVGYCIPSPEITQCTFLVPFHQNGLEGLRIDPASCHHLPAVVVVDVELPPKVSQVLAPVLRGPQELDGD